MPLPACPCLLYLSFAILFLFRSLSAAGNVEKSPEGAKKASYTAGQAISVSCLNRTVDTGEHITDSQGQLQYIPFPVCNETNRPLELPFGIEKDINCTIASISDSLFHLLEFYIHNDAPLTCRIPTFPPPTSRPIAHSNAAMTPLSADDHIPLVFALSGTLQLSHLHVSPKLNLILHTAPDMITEDADIVAATAYSVPALSSQSTRIVIGDSLTLQLSVRWYTSPGLPKSTTANYWLGGHVHLCTVVYSFCSAGVGVAASMAYFRGVELPRRIKRYGKDRLGGGGERGYAFPGGLGVSLNGFGGGVGTGKRD